MGKIKETIIQYGKTTSVKGLSKVVKSNRISLRFLWLIAFFLAAGVGMFQVGMLLTKYFNYDTYTSISVCSGCHPPFPDVTLCNLNPINLLEEYEGIMQLNDYIEYIEDYAKEYYKKHTFKDSDTGFYEEVFGWMYSLQGYFQNMFTPKTVQIVAMSESEKDLVQQCIW